MTTYYYAFVMLPVQHKMTVALRMLLNHKDIALDLPGIDQHENTLIRYTIQLSMLILDTRSIAIVTTYNYVLYRYYHY